MKGDGPKALLQSGQACVRSDRANSVAGVQGGGGVQVAKSGRPGPQHPLSTGRAFAYFINCCPPFTFFFENFVHE